MYEVRLRQSLSDYPGVRVGPLYPDFIPAFRAAQKLQDRTGKTVSVVRYVPRPSTA